MTGCGCWRCCCWYLVYYFSRWCCLIAILGLGRKYLDVGSKLLHYASGAAYPFYILYLLVNTVVGHYVVRWNTGVTVKYLVITVLTTLITIAAYDLLIKRTRLTRFLFGMKPGPDTVSSV